MKGKNIIPYEPVGQIMEESGAIRVSNEAKVILANHLEEYALKLGALAAKYAKHAKRTTILDKDIKLAYKNLE
mgnify:FL=1